MSLITRCPACGTMFKVVPDQLRISEGWVRCGHCAEVFDATANLQDEAQPAVAPPQPPAEAVAAEEVEDASSGSGFVPSVGAFPREPADEELEAEARALRESPADRPFELRRADAGETEAGALPLLPSRPAPLEPEPERDPELQDLSFVRKARRRAFWTSRGMRALLAVATVGLAALLALQFALHERDRIAAFEPGWKPALSALCGVFGCTIGPARQVEAIAIEGSAFNRLRGDAFRLEVTLRNRAPIELAMPALELTLTDSQDQPVLRRVLLAREFAPASPLLPPRAEWSASIAIGVAANGAAARIAGYRVLAFYP